MKKTLKLLIALLTGLSGTLSVMAKETAQPFVNETRTTLVNEGWSFSMEGSTEKETVNLPHDYSIQSGFSAEYEAESGFLPGGTGIYEKTFVFDESLEDHRIVMEWEGAYMNAQVSVNGTVLGSHPYGYTPFAFDLSEALICDGKTENIIQVKTENEIPGSRWYSGSGIYRDVFLTVTGKQYFDRYGITVTTPDLEENASGDVTAHVAMTLGNDERNDHQLTVQAVILDENGNAVSRVHKETVTLEGESRTAVAADLPVHAPQLWQLGEGRQYICRTSLYDGTKLLDSVDTAFGFRWFSFDSERGFFLNGKSVKLKGVCLHHDQGSLGAAAMPGAIDRQLDLLQEMGINAIRSTHNPSDHHLLEECSRRGILMIEEAFDTWTNAKNYNFSDYSSIYNEAISSSNKILGGQAGMRWCEFDTRAMVRHSRNEPCVILYSIGNEILGNIGGDTSAYPACAEELSSWINEEDGTRPVTIADNMTLEDNETQIAMDRAVNAAGGVVGLNYGTPESMDRYHSTFPDWKLYGSETASAYGSRGEYKAKGIDSKTHQITAFDKESVEWGSTAKEAWLNTIERDYIAGEFVWTGFDYLGEPEPWNGLEAGSVTDGSPSPHSSYFGILDTAGFAKDSYYFYQSQWRQDLTVVHILPDWNSRNIRKSLFGTVEVTVYTNAPVIELFLNGKSLGKKTAELHVTGNQQVYRTYDGSLSADWKVAWKKGTLTAAAYDENGNVIENTSGRSTVTTSSKAVSIRTELTRMKQEEYGNELIYVSCTLLDEAGNEVSDQDAALHISLSENGKLLSSDNGNPCDLQAYQAGTASEMARNTFHGKALFILEYDPDKGDCMITISADGDIPEKNISIAGEKTLWNSLLQDLFHLGSES